jgi:hypothetical protein
VARIAPIFLQDLEHVKKLFQAHTGSLVGVGMTAFSRIAPAYFLDSYHVAAFSRTADLPLLRKRADIFCLEEAGGALTESDRNSACLLAHELTRRYLSRLPEPKYLLLYQNYPDLEALAREKGWVLLAGPAALRLRLRERAFFQRMAADLRLCQVPGAILPIAVVFERGYKAWGADLGPELVIQLPDIAQGGGRGTFFIRSAQAYDALRERLKGHAWRDVSLRSVLIRRLVRGVPASVAICITQHGILISGLQRQLIDLPYCADSVENGIFCGHVWNGNPWTPAVQDAALKQAGKIGEYVAGLGYRGILGIDFVIDEESEAVYPLEINPRFTGAFPMLSLLHIQNGVIPLDVFHLIEFLNLPCRIDVAELNRRYQAPLKGSHLLLFFPSTGQAVRGFRVRAGLYEVTPREGAIRFVRDGMGYADIQNENEFVVVDGPPASGAGKGAPSDSFSRLCHLLFSYPVSDVGGALTPHASMALDWIYGRDDDAP